MIRYACADVGVTFGPKLLIRGLRVRISFNLIGTLLDFNLGKLQLTSIMFSGSCVLHPGYIL